MTLCVAWKEKGNIYLASDSRISGLGSPSDYGLKIITVPIKIYSTERDADTGGLEIEFESKYGMGFSGSFVGAYTIREFLMIILQRLQFIPDSMKLSFSSICDIVFKFYKHITQVMKQELGYDHSIDFFFTGYCPKEEKLKIAKYFIDYGSNYEEFKPDFKILEKERFVEATGAGDDEFDVNYENMPNIDDQISKVLNAVKKTIDEKKVQSVGGNLQYGTFEENRFETFGIINYQYNKDGFIEVNHSIAGIDMNGDEFEAKPEELYIMGDYIESSG
ncbi:MAG: hypothetical protein PF638_12445 [Candidatus Delongbacteria bacterium]|jgi:hypothetical protein|nr:hypothetical protein [Candidatus Delongbacteria bacterium]